MKQKIIKNKKRAKMKTKQELEQLNYKFNADVKENVFLYINGVKTTIEIENLFLKVSKREEFLIKGWSVIQKFADIKEYLKNKNIDIDFKNENGDILSFEIEVPFWQLNDKEIDTEDYNKFIEKIEELNRQIVENNKSVENGPGEALPGSVSFNNEKYQRLSSRLKKEGFKELRNGNYILFLYKEDLKENVIIEVTENGYKLIEITKQEDNIISAKNIGGEEIMFVYDEESNELNIFDNNEVFDENELEKSSKKAEITLVEDKDNELEM